MKTYIKHFSDLLNSMPYIFFKQTRFLITARILTVEVPLHSWVHHLEMFSSGVVMLLIFYAVLPPRFLVRNVQNRVT